MSGLFYISTCILTILFRMTGAQKAARDKAENEGVPAHLTQLSSFLSLIISNVMLIELSELLKLLVLLLHPQSVLANYPPLPSFLLLLPFQAAVLVSIVSQKSLLQVKK